MADNTFMDGRLISQADELARRDRATRLKIFIKKRG